MSTSAVLARWASLIPCIRSGIAEPALVWWGAFSQRRSQAVEVFSGSPVSVGAPLGAAQSGMAVETGRPWALWQAAHCNSLTSKVPRSTEGGRTPVWIPARPGRAEQNNAAAASGKKKAKAGDVLSPKQKIRFQTWLEEYRKQWASYWNYLSNPAVAEIIDHVPLSVKELESISGIGESKARLIGEQLIATIYAFLDHEVGLDLIYSCLYYILANNQSGLCRRV